jgi:hypothetical protein
MSVCKHPVCIKRIAYWHILFLSSLPISVFENLSDHVRFEVLMAVTMKITVFWDVSHIIWQEFFGITCSPSSTLKMEPKILPKPCYISVELHNVTSQNILISPAMSVCHIYQFLNLSLHFNKFYIGVPM